MATTFQVAAFRLRACKLVEGAVIAAAVLVVSGIAGLCLLAHVVPTNAGGGQISDVHDVTTCVSGGVVQSIGN